MLIERCTAYKPGLLDKTLLFDKNLSVVYGKNNTGKSLIARAIIDTIWGEVSDKFSLNGNTWDNMRMEILLANSVNHYRFTRNAKKTFSLNIIKSSIKQEDIIIERNIADEGPDIRELFLSSLKNSNDKSIIDLFEKTDVDSFMYLAFMPSSAEVSPDLNLNYNILHSFLLQDESKYYAFYKSLETAFNKEKTNYKLNNPILKEILNLESKIKEYDKQIQVIELQSARIDRLRKEKERLSNDIENLKNDLSKIREIKTAFSDVQERLIKIDLIKADADNLKNKLSQEHEKIKAIKDLNDQLKTEYPQFYNFDEKKKNNLVVIQQLYLGLKNVNESVESYEQKIQSKKKTLVKTIISSFILCASASAGIYASGLLQNFYALRYYVAGGTMLLPAVLLLISYLYIFILSRSKYFKAISATKTEILSKLESVFKENDISITEFKLESLYEFLVRYFEQFGEFSLRQSEIAVIRESLLSSDTIKEIKSEIENMEKQEALVIDEIKTRIPDEIPANDMTIDLINKKTQELSQKIKPAIEQIKINENLIIQISEEVEQEKDTSSEKTRLIEEKNQTENKLKQLYKNKKSVEVIIDIFTNAIKKRTDGQINKLSLVTCDKFHFLTNNQYSDTIGINEIKSIFEGKWENSLLNASATYLLLLSVKIAISTILGELKINLPIIIDEPFQYMDDTRISRLKKLLDDIKEQRQVIIFTHNKNYLNWGKLIEL